MNDGWRLVLAKIGRAFLIVSATVIAAALVAPSLSAVLSLTHTELKWVRLGALGMVAWGVLGRSGWEIQSWKGQNPHERFNRAWFLGLYVVGLFCGAVGLLLEPAPGQ